MNTFRTITVVTGFTLLLGCASSTKMDSREQERIRVMNQKAYDHFFAGALLDFQDQYEKALIEYYQAFLYDSTSSQILKAIGRNLMRLQYYDGAMKTLQKSHHLNPEDKETLNYLSESFYNLQNYQKSIEFYLKLLNLDPYNVTVQNNLIFLYSHLKMEDDLRGFYKRLMSLYPGDTHYSIQYALASIRQKDLPEARRILEMVINTDSTDVNVLNVLGNLYEIQKDTLNAIRIYEKILYADPLNDEILNRLYRIYRNRTEWENMEKLYQSILTQVPDNSQVRLMLAEAHYLNGESDKARLEVEPVLQDEQYRPAAHELLGRIAFEKQDLESAENHFSALTRVNPDNRFGWLFLAVIYNQQSKFDNTLKVLQQSLTLHPDDSDLLSLYGSTLSQVGRDQDAVKPLEKALRIDNENLATLSSMAAVYDKLQEWNKSDSLYILALQKNPDNALILNNYSYSLAQRDLELENALNMVTRALEIDPDNGAYLDTKGWILYKMGNYTGAREYIQKALDSREESAEVLEHMGDVYQKLEQPDKAREFWQRALEKDPSNTNLARKIRLL